MKNHPLNHNRTDAAMDSRRRVGPRVPGGQARGVILLSALLLFPIGALRAQPADPPAGAEAGLAKPPPAELHRQAADLATHGAYDSAVTAFEALLTDESQRMPAVVGIADCYLRTGRYVQAAALLAEHAVAGARSPSWHLHMARCAAKTGAYADTVRHAQEAVQLDKQQWPARLLLAETLEFLGQADEALDQYEAFNHLVTVRLPTDAASLTAVAQGVYRYSVITRHPDLSRRTRYVLNDILQMAYERVDRDHWPARVAAGDLLLEKYNVDEAKEDYEAALRINSSAAEAHVGLGRLALEEWDFETIEACAQKALEVDPHHAGALNLLAAGKIVERRYDVALETCARTLAVNPNDIEALALKASALMALGDSTGADAVIAHAESVSPRNALLHTILGDGLGGRRQFAESEARYRQAIECDPTAPRPRIELGLMYMQWGDEEKAREALDAAWKLDPFNERTKNTLELLDELAAFATIETDKYMVRFDKERDEIVGRAMARHLDSIYAAVCADYEATLPRKTIVEIFPTHSAFAVRITGKPWIHTVGACTGWVIAMDSPRRGSDLQGPYNFANVLKHEFTHTVTLAVTQNRIPHWFTEGLAVLQEDAPQGYNWRQLLTDAVRRDELFTLESIDWGFMRPKRPNDRQMAYAQSEWMCEFIIEQFAYDTINQMLGGYRDGLTQSEVFSKWTGKTMEQFDRDFADWAKRQASTWGLDLTPPEDVVALRALAESKSDDADVHARLARAEFEAQDWERALAAAERSVELDADCRLGHEFTLRTLIEIAGLAEDDAARKVIGERVTASADALLRLDPANHHALAALAQTHLRAEEYEQAEPLLLKLKEVWPFDTMASSGLAGIYLARGNYEAALPELLAVAPTSEHDADIPYQIGDIYERQRQLHDARYWYERALHIDPYSATAQDRLARVHMQLGDTRTAIETYRDLCQIAPDVARHHADCAFAYHQLGDRENARAYAARAVALDKNSPAATLLDKEK